VLLDEPAAGLSADKDALSRLLRRIADIGMEFWSS
jgi:ABC-type branched-subunit amino acid transport system ATPase component